MPRPTPPPPTAADANRWFRDEVQPHEPALKAWLRARFPWLMEVEDIAQEAQFRLWCLRHRTDRFGIRSSKALLFSIARNAVVDLARRRAAVEIESIADPAQLSVLDGADVVEIVNARQELELLADALRALPRRGRQVLTLTKLYGYTEREVAERLGLSEHTVRAHVVRSLARCHEFLRAHGVNRRH